MFFQAHNGQSNEREREGGKSETHFSFPFFSSLFSCIIMVHTNIHTHTHYDDDAAAGIRDIIRDAKSQCNETKQAEEKIRCAETLRRG